MTDNTHSLPRPSFESAGLDAWRARVEQELKGADFDRALRTRLREGFELAPLYTDSEAPLGGAGRAPFVRASHAAPGDWSQGAPWTVVSRFADADLAAENAALLTDLAGGVDGLQLELSLERAAGIDGLEEGLELETQTDLETLLEGVLLDAVQIDLDSGGAVLPAAALLVGHADRRGVARGALRVHFGADPLGALARDGALPCSLDRAFKQAATLVRACEADLTGCRALTLDLGVHHRAGATLVEVLGIGAATLAESFRRLAHAGVEPRDAARRMALSVDIGRETFLEIAGLRALRALWTAVVRAMGVDDVPPPYLRACSSPRMLTERDPWTNILRCAGGAFAAAVGGANAIQVACFDEPLGVPSPLARRVARNTQAVLAEESGLGRVLDPAGGSHYVEQLTRELTERAWAVAQEIERGGGMGAVLADGTLAARLGRSRAALAQAVGKRKHPIVGTTEFPNLEEALPATIERNERSAPAASAPAVDLAPTAPFDDVARAMASGASLLDATRALAAGSDPVAVEPLEPWREAEGFEALRDAGEEVDGPAPVLILALGTRDEHDQRTAWVQNLYATAGLHARVVDMPSEAALHDLLDQHDPVLICLSGGDARYADELAPHVYALRKLVGDLPLYVAGRPGSKESEWRAAGVSGFVHVGMDVLEHLSSLFDDELEEVQA
ncbi:MAG: methylmalonyl-CoA mutase family protein [Planctomycetota bacterium]